MKNIHPDKQLATHFLTQVHKYYPIGLPHFNTDYPGFQLMMEIQKNKVAATEIQQSREWYKLVGELRKTLDSYQIFDRPPYMFPSFELRIQLESYSQTGLSFNCAMLLTVSLLVDYYAIVVIDNYNYMGPPLSGVECKIVCSGALHHLDLDEKISTIKNLMDLHFPNHMHAPHNVLFNYKVLGGYPLNGSYDDLGEYTFYDYLFSNALFKERYVVAH